MQAKPETGQRAVGRHAQRAQQQLGRPLGRPYRLSQTMFLLATVDRSVDRRKGSVDRQT